MITKGMRTEKRVGCSIRPTSNLKLRTSNCILGLRLRSSSNSQVPNFKHQTSNFKLGFGFDVWGLKFFKFEVEFDKASIIRFESFILICVR